MTDKVQDQIERAAELADQMESDGHELSAADLLDCLAICGFMLVDAGDLATEAYHRHLTQRREEE